MSRHAEDRGVGMGKGRLLAAFWAVAAVLLLVPVGAADAYVYWATTTDGTIGRAANDGTDVRPGFISGLKSPFGVAVDSGHIYWPSTTGDAIGRANLDGTGVDEKFIDGLDEPNGIAVGNGFVFWSEGAAARIGRANVDGGNVLPNLVTGVPACGVAVDAGNVYWATHEIAEAHIGRAALGGDPFDLDFVTIPGTKTPCGVAVSPNFIFWADTAFLTGTKIGRADLTSGKNVNASFIGTAKGPCGVAAFAGDVYWANVQDGTIGRATETGGGVDQAFIATGSSQPCGVAVDALAPPPQPPTSQPAVSVDRTAPETRIVFGPGGSGRLAKFNRLDEGIARIYYIANEAATFTCRLDRRKATPCGRWDGEPLCRPLPPKCHPNRTYTGLAPGRHVFRVWATDAAGNKDPTPAKRRFRVP